MSRTMENYWFDELYRRLPQQGRQVIWLTIAEAEEIARLANVAHIAPKNPQHQAFVIGIPVCYLDRPPLSEYHGV